MPFIYSATGERVELVLSHNDVAVRFDVPDVARRAVRSARVGIDRFDETTPRGFGRVVLLHDHGVIPADSVDAAMRSALPARAVRESHRTLQVY